MIHRVCVFSDVHFPAHHPVAWKSFRAWHRKAGCEVTVANGDIVDLEMLSRYMPRSAMPALVKDELDTAVRELNSVSKSTERLIVRPGNHEDRWAKAIAAGKANYLDGLDLSLERTLRDLGLDRGIRWENENNEAPATWLGKKCVAIFHGHRQAGRYGVKNVAATVSRNFPTVNAVVGHHHRAQLMCKTVLDETRWAISCPHLSLDHEYAGTPDWQRGFLVVDLYGAKRLRDCRKATPHLIVMDNEGHFAFEGRVW